MKSEGGAQEDRGSFGSRVLNVEPNENLITPTEASTAIIPHIGGSRQQARALIADALHEGDLVAVAANVWEVWDIDPTDPWENLKSDAKHLLADAEIGPDSWRGSFCWPDETRYWHWKEGNFLINFSEEPLELFGGLMLEDVRFNRPAVLALVGKTDRTGIGGRKSDRAKWADFWVRFLYDCCGDRMDFQIFQNRHQLKQAMLASNPDTFADSNIDFAVSIAWEQLVLRQARERL